MPDLGPILLLRVVLLVTLVAIVWATVLRVCVWRHGRPVSVPLVRGLLTIPKRYLRDVHHVVDRQREASVMHVCAAGGLVVAVASGALIAAVPYFAWLSWTLLFSAIVLIAGAWLAFRRRFIYRIARLSGGTYDLVPFALGGLGLFQFGIALRLTGLVNWQHNIDVALAAVGGTSAMFLAVTAARGPMRHAVAGALHLAYHPRAERFSHLSTDLRPLDFDAPRSGTHLGVGAIEDFAWNRLLSFDACVQCGRCEAACPAHAAGAPLNPKKLIFDLWAANEPASARVSYHGHDHIAQWARDERTSDCANANDAVFGRILPATVWACTTCRACVHECPMMIEHVDAIIDIRRFLTLEAGEIPGKAPTVIENLELTDNPQGRAPDARMAWAAALILPIAADIKRPFDVLLWLGDGAFDSRNQRSLRAFVALLRAANVDFAVLGAEENDCGDVARRLGDEATFQRLARANVVTLQRYRFNRIVTLDPHALHTLRNEYPAFGGRFTLSHHTAMLAELFEGGSLPIAPDIGSAATYHDPCYLARYNGEVEGPRRLLHLLGIELSEMKRSGLQAMCCGGGGGAPLTDIQSKKRIADVRMAQAKETSAERLIVACPNCANMFEGVAHGALPVFDICELVLDAYERGRNQVTADVA